MYWISLLVFVLHIIEEYPRFPAWATRHFGATSNAWYAYSHIGLVAVAVAICSMAQEASPQSWGALLGTALMWTLAFNAVFHVGTTLLYREYSPGVITGVLLFFPASAYVLYRTIWDELLTPEQIAIAVLIALVVQVGVIASLYLRMDIDWRFRRKAS